MHATTHPSVVKSSGLSGLDLKVAESCCVTELCVCGNELSHYPAAHLCVITLY